MGGEDIWAPGVGFALDCSGVQPHQGALPHSFEAWESTLVILAGMGTKEPTARSLSPLDCQCLER